MNIKARRAHLGLTQHALAERLEVEVETISRYERGSVAPSFPQLEKLCTVLELQAWQLFSDGSVVPDAQGRTLDELLAQLTNQDREFLLAFVRDYVGRPSRAALMARGHGRRWLGYRAGALSALAS